MERTPYRLIFLCLIKVVLIGSALGLEFFVSPIGDDSNSGSKAAPFQSFKRAKKAVGHSIRNTDKDIFVTFADGFYQLNETLEFGPEDSPLGENKVIYRAAQNARPIFSGGGFILDWEPHNETLWKAKLVRANKLRSLYVNDERSYMARDIGPKKIKHKWGKYTVNKGQASWAWQNGTVFDGVVFERKLFPEFKENSSNLELVALTTWNRNIVGIRDIQYSEDEIIFKFQQPYGAIAQQIGWSAGLFGRAVTYSIQNSLSLIDAPGEFYYDPAQHTIYYYPRFGEDLETAQVIAPKLETLIRIEGDLEKGLVKNLVFEGLEFSHSDYNLFEISGSSGKVTLQGATILQNFSNPNWHYDVYRSYDVIPGAIEVSGAQYIKFIGNTVAYTGSDGLVMTNQVSDVEVVGNTFFDTAGSAITIGHPQHVYENDDISLLHPEGASVEKEKYHSKEEFAPKDVLISNNFLVENAALFWGHSVIQAFFTKDLIIQNNWIKSAPYTGIHVGWGWCDFDGAATVEVDGVGVGRRPSVFPGNPSRVSTGNLIIKNKIEDTMLKLRDGGAIYTLGNMPNSFIERNYVRGTENAIYTDEGSAYITCRKNVIESPYKSAHSGNSRGRNHEVEISGYFMTRDSWRDGSQRSFSLEEAGHVLCEANQWPYEAQQIIEESGLQDHWEFIFENWSQNTNKRRTFLKQKARENALEKGKKAGGKYEAELAELSGSCVINDNHAGFSGRGFVAGYYRASSANTCFTVEVSQTQDYDLLICYSAGLADCEDVEIQVNGEKSYVTHLTRTPNWTRWKSKTLPVTLKKGFNQISIRSAKEMPLTLNLDYIQLLGPHDNGL